MYIIGVCFGEREGCSIELVCLCGSCADEAVVVVVSVLIRRGFDIC